MAVIPASAIAQPSQRPDRVLDVVSTAEFLFTFFAQCERGTERYPVSRRHSVSVGGISNFARLTLPSVTYNSNGDTGIGDATLFNLAAFDRSWGRYGIGVVALLPTGADGVSAEKWGLGPALGFVARPGWGLARLFNQNILTVAGDNTRPDVNISTLQPIVSYTLGQGWSVGTSDMTVVYDWDRSEFTSLPIGLKVSKLTKLGGVPVQWQLSYERNFYDTGTGPQDTIGLTAKLLVPK